MNNTAELVWVNNANAVRDIELAVAYVSGHVYDALVWAAAMVIMYPFFAGVCVPIAMAIAILLLVRAWKRKPVFYWVREAHMTRLDHPITTDRSLADFLLEKMDRAVERNAMSEQQALKLARQLGLILECHDLVKVGDKRKLKSLKQKIKDRLPKLKEQPAAKLVDAVPVTKVNPLTKLGRMMFASGQPVAK